MNGRTGTIETSSGNITCFGGPGFRQAVDDRTRDQGRLSLTWFLGESHEFRVRSSAACGTRPEWVKARYRSSS